MPVERIGIAAHAGRGGVGELGEGERAMDGDEHVADHDVLAAGAREPHRVPVVVDAAVGRGHEEKSRLGRTVRLRDHAAEKLPLRVVAAAAEASRPGQPVSAVRRDCVSDRRIGPGGERAAVVPDLVLRRARKAGDQPLVRGEQAIDPAGRPATAGNGGDDLDEHVESVLEAAVGLAAA